MSILGGPDIYIKAGSPIHLECVVTNFVIPPLSVSWTRNHKLLDKNRYSGLSHKVDRKLNMSSNFTMTDILTSFTSSLKISLADTADAGNYSCHLESIPPATISLHVLRQDGEHLPVTGGVARNSDGRIPLYISFVILSIQQS